MSENLLEKLNPEQASAVTHKSGPLMIVAGAGTGKTMVITHRIAWLIEKGLAKPEEILALTFTEKAASEMEERVDRLLPYGYVDLQISTFHSFAERLLREYGVEIGLPREFRIVSELDAWLLARKNFEKFNLDYFRPLGNPTKYIRSLLTHFSRAKDVGVDPVRYAAHIDEKRADLDSKNSDDNDTALLSRFDELAGAYVTYQNILLENDCLDFGDLMLYTLKLLKERPFVLKKIRSKYKFVLVDEFQDTNDAQYEIVRIIAEPKNNLTVVGDDDQSIYRFRGASLANILRFEKDYPDAAKVVLTANYRSAQNILDTAHCFIQKNNPNRLESTGALCKKLEAKQEIDGIINHLHAATIDEEIKLVIEKMHELRKKKTDVDWGDFAVLVRSNSMGADFASAFERHGIPFQFFALSGLYTKPVILDMLALMRVVDNPFDSPSFYRLLTSKIANVGERTILELNRIAARKGKSTFEICELGIVLGQIPETDRWAICSLLEKIVVYQKYAKTKKITELFVVLAKESGYLDIINKMSERKKIEGFGFLQQFYERLKSFEKSHDHPVLHNFLSEFDHELAAGEEGSISMDIESGPEAVRIMTVHASKGLEFRYVFVVNLVDQKFPTRAMRDAIELPEGLGPRAPQTENAHIEEERRLFYVAITRAKEGLFFTSADDYGGARKRKISQFLRELNFESKPSIPTMELEIIDSDLVSPDETLPRVNPPKRFSFTQLAAFNACPLQYKFAHVLKVPVVGKWTFSFGKTMHNTLDKFFSAWLVRTGSVQTNLFEKCTQRKETELPVSFEELMNYYTECWQDDWYEDDSAREKYRSNGRESLRAFYRELEALKPKPLFIEQDFTVKFGDVVVKGRIDRIDEFEDGVEIIDYKTGTPKKELSKEDKEQLLLYQLAAKQSLGLNPKLLTYYYLTDNSRVSFIGSSDELLDIEDKIISSAKAIAESRFQPSPGFQCRFCDFASICEFRDK